MTNEENKNKIKKNDLAAAPAKRVIKLNEGSKKARNSAARLAAVQIWYQVMVTEQKSAEVLREFIDHRIGFELDGDVFVPAEQGLLTNTIDCMRENRSEIEEMVSATLGQGKHDDVEPLLKAIMLMGVCEIMSYSDIDIGIIIADYLKVANAFYDKGEVKLVNAVLDKLAKTLRN